MIAAWHAGVVGRAAKIPPLEQLIGEKRAATQQTPAQMLAVMSSLVGKP